MAVTTEENISLLCPIATKDHWRTSGGSLFQTSKFGGFFVEGVGSWSVLIKMSGLPSLEASLGTLCWLLVDVVDVRNRIVRGLCARTTGVRENGREAGRVINEIRIEGANEDIDGDTANYGRGRNQPTKALSITPLKTDYHMEQNVILYKFIAHKSLVRMIVP